MQIYRYKPGEALALPPSVTALGLFDGVHNGHRALIKEAALLSRRKGLPLSVFTFDGSSQELKGGSRLYSDKIKHSLLSELGVDYIISADFSRLADVSAESFIEKTLLSDIKTDIAVSGGDFRFGKARLGDSSLLRCRMEAAGKGFHEVADMLFGGKKISTSMIKELLSSGRAKEASHLLGKPYFLEDSVQKGLGLGHRMGIPTVNISLQNSKDFLKYGVYASLVKTGGNFYTGLTNIGTCPTFGEREAHSETFILNFSESLYGEEIRVYLLEYIREERKFSSADELIKQIKIDTGHALSLTEDIKWQEIGIN